MTWTQAFQAHPGEMLLWTAIMGGVALGFVLSAIAALVSIFRGRPYPRYDYRYDRYPRHPRRQRWERERRRVRLPHGGRAPQVPVHAFYRGGGPGIAA